MQQSKEAATEQSKALLASCDTKLAFTYHVFCH